MGAAAVAAGRAIGYHNAGTVEFVVDATGEFYFLEVNTRLQVEHPVTEEVTGLDLVRLQILVAQGEPLPLRQEDARAPRPRDRGARLRRGPAHGLPAVDRHAASRWEEAQLPGRPLGERRRDRAREVTIHYDPMLAKVIAHAPTRAEAAQRLARALARDARRTASARTCRCCSTCSRHPEFLAGALDTHFIGDAPRRSTARRPTPSAEADARARRRRRALARRRGAAPTAPVLRGIPSGWRNNPSQMQEVAFTSGDATIARALSRAHAASRST